MYTSFQMTFSQVYFITHSLMTPKPVGERWWTQCEGVLLFSVFYIFEFLNPMFLMFSSPPSSFWQYLHNWHKLCWKFSYSSHSKYNFPSFVFVSLAFFKDSSVISWNACSVSILLEVQEYTQEQDSWNFVFRLAFYLHLEHRPTAAVSFHPWKVCQFDFILIFCFSFTF